MSANKITTSDFYDFRIAEKENKVGSERDCRFGNKIEHHIIATKQKADRNTDREWRHEYSYQSSNNFQLNLQSVT